MNLKYIGIIVIFPFIGIITFILLIVILFAGGGGETGGGDVGNTLAYLKPITQQAQDNGIPPLWSIADVAWESSGNWLATNDNTNGTTDAGLCQINSVNWSSYGLEDDPYDITKNLKAGTKILGSAFKRYGNIEDALYAYNGGTPDNGKRYNPGYFPNVSYIYQLLQSNYLIARVHSYEGNVLNLTVGQAIIQSHRNKDGDDIDEVVGFDNPSSITVTISGKGGSFGPVKVRASSGDNLGLGKESTAYQVESNQAINTGDQVSVTTSNGYSTQITVTDSKSGSSLTPGNASAMGYSWPVPGNMTVTSPFGPRVHPVTHQISYHEGIDISAQMGTSIIAPKDGIVDSVSYSDPVYGYYIYLRHNDGVLTFYGHVQTINVFPGAEVHAGDVIATVGTRGMSTGPHLHFGVKVDGQWVSPLNYVSP